MKYTSRNWLLLYVITLSFFLIFLESIYQLVPVAGNMVQAKIHTVNTIKRNIIFGSSVTFGKNVFEYPNTLNLATSADTTFAGNYFALIKDV